MVSDPKTVHATKQAAARAAGRAGAEERADRPAGARPDQPDCEGGDSPGRSAAQKRGHRVAALRDCLEKWLVFFWIFIETSTVLTVFQTNESVNWKNSCTARINPNRPFYFVLNFVTSFRRVCQKPPLPTLRYLKPLTQPSHFPLGTLSILAFSFIFFVSQLAGFEICSLRVNFLHPFCHLETDFRFNVNLSTDFHIRLMFPFYCR